MEGALCHSDAAHLHRVRREPGGRGQDDLGRSATDVEYDVGAHGWLEALHGSGEGQPSLLCAREDLRLNSSDP